MIKGCLSMPHHIFTIMHCSCYPACKPINNRSNRDLFIKSIGMFINKHVKCSKNCVLFSGYWCNIVVEIVS